MRVPADEAFDEFHHVPRRSAPRTEESFLVVDHIRGGIHLHAPALANHHHFAPFAGGAESHRSGGMVCRAFNGPLDAMSVREMTDVSVVLINKSPAGPQETAGIFTCSNRGQRMALIPKLTR